MKTTKTMRSALVTLLEEGREFYGWETWAALAYAGLVTGSPDDEKALTDAGRAIAIEEQAKRAAARARRNAAARGRAAAFASVGMKRTRYGWE